MPQDQDLPGRLPGPESHGDPVAALERWTSSGGTWRVVSHTDTRVVVGLFSCDGGEEMGRVTASADALAGYLAGRTESDD